MKFYIYILVSLGVSVFAIYSGIRMNDFPESEEMRRERGTVTLLVKYKKNFRFELAKGRGDYVIGTNISDYNDELLTKLNALKNNDSADLIAYQDFWEDNGTLTVMELKINNDIVFDTQVFKQAQRHASYYAFGVGGFMLLLFLFLTSLLFLPD